MGRISPQFHAVLRPLQRGGFLGRHAVSLLAFMAVFAMPLTALSCDGLVDGPQGTVTAVTDGDTIILDTGLVVRLIGIQAPKLPRGNDTFSPWPKSADAKAALETLVTGKKVRLRYGGEKLDRHGRSLGQLFVQDEPETWVQGQLVADGMARVYSFPDNRSCIADLMIAEGRARLNRLGIWADPYYAVRRADKPGELVGRSGHYELVEGRVLAAEQAGGRVYLNFGRTWKTDFTVVIDKAALGRFNKDGLDPLKLADALLRVRGWVDTYNGPRIEVTHPEQIEVLATR
jgi:endonuclease YncB( thermonuclease family)